MKNFFKLMLLLLLVLPFQACSDDDGPSVTKLEVTSNNLAGIWKLHSWSGVAGEQPVVYIEFIRKHNKFRIYQTYNSMLPEVKTGTFEIDSSDYYKGDVLKGKYDNGMGEWNNTYIVTALYETTLELKADTKEFSEVQTYVRVSELPTDILDNLPQFDEMGE